MSFYRLLKSYQMSISTHQLKATTICRHFLKSEDLRVSPEPWSFKAKWICRPFSWDSRTSRCIKQWLRSDFCGQNRGRIILPLHFLATWSWASYLILLSLNFSLWNWDNDCYLTGLLWELNEIMCLKRSRQSTPGVKHCKTHSIVAIIIPNYLFGGINAQECTDIYAYIHSGHTERHVKVSHPPTPRPNFVFLFFFIF